MITLIHDDLEVEILCPNLARFGFRYDRTLNGFKEFTRRVLNQLGARPNPERGNPEAPWNLIPSAGRNCYITRDVFSGDMFRKAIEASCEAEGLKAFWHTPLPEDDINEQLFSAWGDWGLSIPTLHGGTADWDWGTKDRG